MNPQGPVLQVWLPLHICNSRAHGGAPGCRRVSRVVPSKGGRAVTHGLVEISQCLRGLTGVLDTPGMVCLQEGGWGGPQVRAVLGVHTFGARCTLGVGHCQGEGRPTGLGMGRHSGGCRGCDVVTRGQSPKLLFLSRTLHPAFASTWSNVQPEALWDFPGCPVVGTLHFHCWGHADRTRVRSLVRELRSHTLCDTVK